MSDPNKISPTAWIVAKVRSEYTDIPYCKEIFQEISKEMNPLSMKILFSIIRWVIKHKPEKFQGMTTAEGRYLNINDALPKNKKYVLLELASGLSPRSIEKSREGVIVMETDLPRLINLKERVLEAIYGKNKKPDHHYLLTINVLHREELETVGKLYQKVGKNLPLYIVHEGLLPYFSDEEKTQLRDNMKWFLNKFAPQNGYWVTTDFSPYPQKEKGSFVYNVIKIIIEKVTRRTANWTENEEDVTRFLKEAGLKSEKLVNSNLEKSLTIVNKVNLPRDEVVALNREYAALLIQPEKDAKRAAPAESKKPAQTAVKAPVKADSRKKAGKAGAAAKTPEAGAKNKTRKA